MKGPGKFVRSTLFDHTNVMISSYEFDDLITINVVSFMITVYKKSRVVEL